MVSSARQAVAAVGILAATAPVAVAFAGPLTSNGDFPIMSRSPKIALHAAEQDTSRRDFLVNAAAASASALLSPLPAFAADSKESLIANLNESLSKIETIPPLVESAEWDKIRTILKTPPVNELWNLGESKNTLMKLAKETGEFELVDIKDELAISLQMTDQYSYDNVFIYYQPGNGKIKTKEPLEMARKSISQLKEALNMVNSS